MYHVCIAYLLTCLYFKTSPSKLINGHSSPSKDKKTGDIKGSGDMTSKDYYFDSYAHFGIHEVNQLFRLIIHPHVMCCGISYTWAYYISMLALLNSTFINMRIARFLIKYLYTFDVTVFPV